MARYTTHNKRESGNKTKTVLAVLVIIVLVFTILAGLVKSFALPGSAFEPNSAWDGKSSFAVALDTNPSSVFIYQREPKRIVFLGLDSNMYFVTGNPKTPVAKISDAISGSKDFDIARVMALSFGAPVTNYAVLSKRENLDNKVAQKMFKDFASLTTPFIVMTRGKPSFIKNTNITRYDAFRLWWQVKGLSVESVNVSDISALSEEIVVGGGRKVLGVDTTSLNRKIHDYLENINVIKEGYNISILNESGNPSAAGVAADFIQASGGNVVSEKEGDIRESSQVVVRKKGDYTPSYLAKIFGCDIRELVSMEKRELVSSELEITQAQNNGSNNELTVVLGRDFANKYFK